MKIAGRGGHSLDVRGASGIIDEVTEDRLIVKKVFEFLELHGVEILNVTPTYSKTSAVDLTVACKKANDWGADFYFSIHLNASGGRGVEVIYGSAAGKVYADRICNKIAALGFPNRGTYSDRRGLYEFKGCKMPNVIIEVCFVDNASDVALYHKLGYSVIAKAIVEGILGNTISDTPVNNVVTSDPAQVVKSNDMYGVVTASTLNIRTGASTNNSVIGKLSKGDKVKIGFKENGWYNIYYGDKGGFVSADFVKVEPVNRLVTATSLNVRNGASTYYTAIGTLKQGEIVKVGSFTKNGWANIFYGDKGGFVSGDYLK